MAREWNKESRVIMVEGHSDAIFIDSLLKKMRVTGYFIHILGGKDKRKQEVSNFLKPYNLGFITYVALILDADDSDEDSFKKAQSSLSDICPDIKEVAKWYGSTPRSGIFIMGKDARATELESLVWEAWKSENENKPLLDCVEQFIACLNSKQLPTKSIDKVRMGAVLSVLNEDDPRIGPAARANLFNFQSPIFESLREFLAQIS